MFFEFDDDGGRWNRGRRGEIRLSLENEGVKLVMESKNFVCTHLICSDMQLKPNIISDRSWVWTVAAENTSSGRTLAVRFPKPTGATDALQFKTAFEDAQTRRGDGSVGLTLWYAPTPPRDEEEEDNEYGSGYDDGYACQGDGEETGSMHMALAVSTIVRIADDDGAPLRDI
ncbi:hypothetical protein B0H14DRAFT_2802902 [Mycena olivaceomarginata]|nr:hypothetical protein B0H14DRAFT_2802902 [Mycena olivaceomarginata]